MKQLLPFLFCLSTFYTTYSQPTSGYHTITHDSSSFATIAASFGEAGIVGLGESAHGSREMSVFKTAFIKHLMQHTPYRVLVMEDHFYECSQVNKYLLTGEGDPQEVFSMIKGLCRTPDFLELLQWMREYNSQQTSEAQMVRLYGADMQRPSAIPHLLAYLNTHDMTLPAQDVALLEQLNSKSFDIRKQPKETQTELAQSITSLENALHKTWEKTPELTTTEEHALMLQQLRIVKQFFENETAGVLKWATYRDKKMAENIGWIYAQEQHRNNKLLVWAHSGHLNNVNTRMGSYLKKSHPNYFILGQDFISGSTNAIYQKQQLFTYELQEQPKLLANYFTDKPGETFFLNLGEKAFTKTDLHRYMQLHPLVYNEGANKATLKIKAGKQFDALIIHRSSTPKF